jgi:hypothetical protein
MSVMESTQKMQALRLNLTVKENRTIHQVNRFSYDVRSNVVNIIMPSRSETREFIY